MEQNFPKYIRNESDLAVYEGYLRKHTEKMPVNQIRIENGSEENLPEHLKNPIFFQCFLKKHIGKLIKAESLIGNQLDTRIGILLEIGSDYMVIKPGKNCVTTVIDLKCVKYVSIIHDNNYKFINGAR